MTKDWKYYLGLSLFIYSLAPIVIVALLPFFGMDLAEMGTLAVVFLTSGEVSFWGAAVLLGKPFMAALKQKFASWFRREAAPPQPISRARHLLGVWLLVISFLPYYAVLVYLLFFVPDNATIHFLAWTMAAGEMLGIVSLFVLGGQFWERLKRLFQWQDERDSATA
ncbi:MAG: transporter suffix domain-containing protein [Desulfarculaceae bacterium]|nr:transporter suffix domain-containing protein [Desulfarculaceae bacterium]MCF8049125.1 transporter suffix domain-containing protein [Desulfarculaceae bacterium]MCF8097198.1 transporter suffix domain-containing protein [Desulfarculaceae bacterium]MCF8122743.1 transporter suffix domain-containing protein [Desulfarculaceae bacterium]